MSAGPPPSDPPPSGPPPSGPPPSGPHDAWARLTPYEMGIPGREFAEASFQAISEEAEVRGVDATDPGAFLLLGQVGRVIREIQGEEDRGGEALQRFGAFLFHAYHLHRAGEPLILMETATARHLVDEEPELAGWGGELPGHAGYLQLPRHLFWSRPRDEGPAEAVDGIFWARSTNDTLSLLVALGVRGDRAGFSTVSLPPLPLSEAGSWVTERARDDGTDFETTLPGGELDRLYSLETLGEVLKLMARSLAFLHAAPESLGEEERSPQAAHPPEDVSGPVPSQLPFRRLRRTGPREG